MKSIWSGWFSLPLLMFTCSGCGDSDKGLNMGGQVTGTIKIDGKDVTAGDVVFLSENGRHSVVGPINEYGKYTVKEPPLGKCKILVQTSSKKGGKRPNGKESGADVNASRGMVLPDPNEIGMTYVETPAKYEKAETSPLTFEVKKGNTEFPIELLKE